MVVFQSAGYNALSLIIAVELLYPLGQRHDKIPLCMAGEGGGRRGQAGGYRRSRWVEKSPFPL